jgi:hypothetical protein
MKATILACAAAAILGLGALFTAEAKPAPRPAPDAWEYRVLHEKHDKFHADTLEYKLNEKGKDGWELVSTAVAETESIAVFKRQKK